MDINSLYYFSELAKDMNMTRTAERLYVSQQTISNHILRLEEHYGTRLFYRKPSLSLTYAGECALEFARRLLRDQQNLEDFLGDIGKQGKGALHFGASPLRLNDALPAILPSFSSRYPEVEMQVTSGFSSRLEPMVVEGKLDMAIVLDKEEMDATLEKEFLADDQVYFCVSSRLLEETDEWKGKAIKGIEVTDCLRVPLCLTENRMGDTILNAFRAAQKEPRIYLTSSDSNLAFMVCCTTGAAGAFIGHSRLVNGRDTIPKDMDVFPLMLNGKLAVQRLCLIHRKDRYLPAYARFFGDLLKQYFGEIEQFHMEQLGTKEME